MVSILLDYIWNISTPNGGSNNLSKSEHIMWTAVKFSKK
jgi:hypothetical protein